jgi:hypothetical protein
MLPPLPTKSITKKIWIPVLIYLETVAINKVFSAFTDFFQAVGSQLVVVVKLHQVVARAITACDLF